MTFFSPGENRAARACPVLWELGHREAVFSRVCCSSGPWFSAPQGSRICRPRLGLWRPTGPDGEATLRAGGLTGAGGSRETAGFSGQKQITIFVNQDQRFSFPVFVGKRRLLIRTQGNSWTQPLETSASGTGRWRGPCGGRGPQRRGPWRHHCPAQSPAPCRCALFFLRATVHQ